MALVGNLKDLKMASLIQINCMEKNVAKLLVEYRGQYGSLYFANGQIVHAEFGEKIGEEAVFALLHLKEGTFKVEGEIIAPTQTINNSWSNLLLEGMRQIDEATVDVDKHAEETVDLLVGSRGVEEASIFTANGEVVAASHHFNAKMIPFFRLMVHKLGLISQQVQYGRLKGCVVTIEDKYFLTKIGQQNLALKLEDKSQIDVILPQITPLVERRSERF
jgi:hypothetical protein